jgi:hypothetical protein
MLLHWLDKQVLYQLNYNQNEEVENILMLIMKHLIIVHQN